LDISLEDFQKHIRGDVELPVSGLVDMIAATSTKSYKDGKVKAVSGDSYIMLVRYSKDEVEIETVLPYGVSTHADSPHYTDQMSLYVNHQRKKMSLDKGVIMNNAIRVYHPK
jgi:acyl-homoserine-lactone acylase